MFVVLDLMKTTGSRPDTSNHTSQEPRKSSLAQRVKSFLAWKLKILPNCIISKTIRLLFVSGLANFMNVLKRRKLTNNSNSGGCFDSCSVYSVYTAGKLSGSTVTQQVSLKHLVFSGLGCLPTCFSHALIEQTQDTLTMSAFAQKPMNHEHMWSASYSERCTVFIWQKALMRNLFTEHPSDPGC